MKQVVFLICLLSNLALFAQKQGQDRVDSLLAELTIARADKSKLDVYIHLINTYNDFDREEGLKFEKPAIDLANKIGSAAALAKVKNAVGRTYWRKGDFEVALRYHQQAKIYYEQSNDEPNRALTIRFIGQDYADGGNYPEALKYFTTALEWYIKAGDLENIGHMYNLLAWVYNKQGDHAEAARSSYLSLTFFEKSGNPKYIAFAASDVAEYYILLGNYEEALKYFLKSEEVNLAVHNRISLGHNYNRIGKVYQLMGKYAESLKNYETAFSLGKEVDDANIMALAYTGMAEIYEVTKEYQKARYYYLNSVELFKKSANRNDLARAYCQLGGHYKMVADFKLSKAYYDSAFTLATELNSRTLLMNYYKGIESLDSAQGNWKDAYFNRKKYAQNRDSVFNQDIVKKMVQLQLQYEFDKREANAKAAQAEKDLLQQMQVVSLSIIALLILILAIVLYKNHKRILKINQELKQKSETLEEENREKSSILDIVSHDLKAPFNKIKGLSEIMRLTENLNKVDKEVYLNHIGTSIDQGNYLINKLLEAHHLSLITKPPVLESVDVTKFIHDFQVAVTGQLLKKQQHLHVDIQLKNSHMLMDQNMLTRILDNLVSNASKFSVIGKSIFLRVWSDDKDVHLSVRDEGPGISEEDQKKMFRKFQKLSAIPTSGEDSTGLGLSITKSIVEKLNGSIRVVSKMEEGTEVVVSFPVIS